LFRDAQYWCHLNILTDTERWLVTSTGRCVNSELQVTDRYCGHKPERVININGTAIMWDVPAITYRTILANRPDILLHDKNEKTGLLIDIALLVDSNVNTKESDKLCKFKDLEIKFNRMWELRTKIVPITTGVLGTIKKDLDHNLQLLSDHRSAIELQKITLMSTAQSNLKVIGEIAVICCWELDLLEDRHLSTNRRE
jgi:hypothetical protein